MTWVPPYAIADCQERLNEPSKGFAMQDGLTHLSLQFWHPSKNGGLEFVSKFQKINDAKIAEFRKWSDAHDVKLMLCVYNGTSSGWDWKLARSAFELHREKLVDSLVSETLRLNLDGVDIDFEGKGKLDTSKESFVHFIKELSARLHAEGKELTVNSFAYKWHAPNQSWWPALLPYVDGLQVMGYAETGANAADWRSYSALKLAADKHASKLLIGMPSNLTQWQNSSAIKHLEWLVADPSLGLAIWDAQLKSPTWKTPKVWKIITKIKKGSK